MAKSIFQSVLVICFLQLLNKIMTFDEICTISTLCRGNAYTYSQVCFTYTTITQKYDVFTILDESECLKIQYLLFVY